MSKRTWMSGFKLNIHAPGTGFALMLLALTQVPVTIKTTAEIFCWKSQVRNIIQQSQRLFNVMAVNESISIINRVISYFYFLISTQCVFRTLKEGRKAVVQFRQQQVFFSLLMIRTLIHASPNPIAAANPILVMFTRLFISSFYLNFPYKV